MTDKIEYLKNQLARAEKLGNPIYIDYYKAQLALAGQQH